MLFNKDDLSFTKFNNNSVLLTSSANLRNKFFKISERKTPSNKFGHMFNKRTSIGELSGIFGKSVVFGKSFNMSQFDSQCRRTMNSSYLNKTVEINPEAETVKDDEEEFINNFKGKIPLSLINNIDPEKDFDKLKNVYKDLQESYDEFFKADYNTSELKNKVKNLLKDYERAKVERDNISAQLYETKKRLELNQQKINSEINTDDILKKNISNLEPNNSKGPTIEQQINDIKDQISKIKSDNQKFFEDYDYVSDTYNSFLLENKRLKNEVNKLDEQIKQTLLEKNRYHTFLKNS